MKYIVLLSDGIFNHSFQLFETKEQAEIYASKIKSNHGYVEVNELIINVCI